MANIKSQIKRIKTNEKSRVANKMIRSQIKTAIKAYKASLKENNEANQTNARNIALSLVDKSVTKGVYHKNKASHFKSQIMKFTA